MLNSSHHYKSAGKLFQDLHSSSKLCQGVEILLYLLVLTIGVFGNSAVIWIVYKKRHLKNSTYFFIGSLALSDVLLFVSAGWESIVVLIRKRWVLGHFICQFQGYSVISLACASLLTMALTSLNRYFKVVQPSKYGKVFTPIKTKILIAITWVLAYIEPLPYLLSGKRYIFHPGKLFCFQENEVSVVSLLPFIYIGISTSVISTCYFRIFNKLRRHKHDMKYMKKEIKATRTMFLTVVGFMICWIPICIIDIIEFTREDLLMPRQVYVMYTFLGNFSAMINPIIYGVMNRWFRKEFRRLKGHNQSGRITVRHLVEVTKTPALSSLDSSKIYSQSQTPV